MLQEKKRGADMKGRGLLLIFTVGCILLFAAFGIGYANWGDLANRIGIVQILMGTLGVIVLVLVAMSILDGGKARWTALTLCAILLLGFSVLLIFSVGWLIAPVALLLLGFSLWRLRRQLTKRSIP